MGAPPTNEDRAPGEGFLVLWAGSAEISERDTQVELRRAGVRVEVASPEELADRANERSPDLIVLGGEPAEDPEPLVIALRGKSPGSAVPIVALAPRAAAAPRPRARFGLVAKLDRDLDAPATAGQLVTLLEGLSTRASVWRMGLRDTTLATVASGLASSARAGVLVARGAGAIAIEAEGEVVPTALEAPSALADAHFHERPPGRVRVARELTGGSVPSLEGARVVIVDDDEERRGRIAKRLEQAKAQVRAVGAVAQAVQASRALDPSVVVLAAPALQSAAISPLWSEPRLAVAALLVLDGEALLAKDAGPLVADVAALCRAEVELGRALRDQRAVAERVETLGPARWLKLLGRCSHEVTLRVYAASGRMRVDLAGGRIQGASFRPAGQDEVIDGRAAVDAFMALPFGRVLAGPPTALAALEGVSARRKPSMVGRLEPASPSAPRKSGLVAEEVVIKRTDATQLPFGPPKRLGRATPAEAGEPEPSDEPARSSLVPLGDLAEGDDVPTSSYAPETLEELRASLRSGEPSEAVTAPPPGRAGKLKKSEESAGPTAPPPRRRRQTDEERAGAGGGEADAEAERGRAGAEENEAAGVDASEPEHEASAIEPERASVAERSSAPPVAVQSVTASPRKTGTGGWFAAGILVALGVGAWAAWRLPGEQPAGRPIAHSPSTPVADEAADAAAPEDASQPSELERPAETEPAEAEPALAEAVDAGAASSEAEPDEASPLAAAPDTAPEPEATLAAPDEALAPTDAANRSAAQLIVDAQAAVDRRDYARSEALSRRALELSPQNPRAGYRLAVALFRQQRYDEALAQAEATAEWDRTDPLAFALQGDILSRRGRFNEAARAYQRALEVEPRFGPAERGLERLRERGVEP